MAAGRFGQLVLLLLMHQVSPHGLRVQAEIMLKAFTTGPSVVPIPAACVGPA